MMFNNVGFVLNMMTLIISLCACVISLPIIMVIFYHLRGNRTKREDRVTLILSANIYPLIFVYSLILVSFNFQTLFGDLYQWNFQSTWCIFLGYFSPAVLCMLYWAFVNQVCHDMNHFSAREKDEIFVS